MIIRREDRDVLLRHRSLCVVCTLFGAQCARVYLSQR